MKTYKILSINQSLDVLLYDVINHTEVTGQIKIHNSDITGVCSVLLKSDKNDGYAILGVCKNKQFEKFIQGNGMLYIKGGGSILEHLKPISNSTDIIIPDEISDPKAIPGLNIHIVTNEPESTK